MEQALKAAQDAIDYCAKQSEAFEVDLWVVDNQSVDGSVAFIRERFPDIQLVANEENVGFSKANNQAIRASKGEYVLLLNPDTIVPENCFQKIILFMDEHPEAGGLGVRMVDGCGVFLPESKRGLPTPGVALSKMLGLSSLFPKSKRFNRYHLGYLDEMETHEVEILSGAFMMMRRSVLDKVGLLDETYFMYGEDIDLSYEIIKGGYKNYYYPGTTIIHYKGESTKKGSLNYVKVFYNAMIIFAKKHFQEGGDGWYTRAIRFGVYLRALLAIVLGFVKRISPYLLDAGLIIIGLLAVKFFWEATVKIAPNRNYYSPEYLYFNIPLYTCIWMLSNYFSGAYDRPLKWSRLIRGLLVGTVLISAVYGFLPDAFRFSRSMILLGAGMAIFLLSTWRIGSRMWSHKRLEFDPDSSRKLAIVGEIDEVERVRFLLGQTRMEHQYMGFVQVRTAMDDSRAIGKMDQLKALVKLYKLEELILCHRDLSASQVIKVILELGSLVQIRTIAEDGESIIGSHSKNTAGELYALDLNLNINQPRNIRNKRVFDLLSCFGFLLLLPVMLLLVSNKTGFLVNWAKVFVGRKSWVGFGAEELEGISTKVSVLDPLDEFSEVEYDKNMRRRLLQIYAREYTVYHDLLILWKGRKNLGRPVSKPKQAESLAPFAKEEGKRS